MSMQLSVYNTKKYELCLPVLELKIQLTTELSRHSVSGNVSTAQFYLQVQESVYCNVKYQFMLWMKTYLSLFIYLLSVYLSINLLWRCTPRVRCPIIYGTADSKRILPRGWRIVILNHGRENKIIEIKIFRKISSILQRSGTTVQDQVVFQLSKNLLYIAVKYFYFT